MNVALVIFRAEPERGGAERYVHDLAAALLSRGHQVSVLASSGSAVDGATFVRIRAGGVTRTARYRRFCRNIEKHLSAGQYDVVHSCMPIPRCDVYHAQSGLESLSLRDGHLAEPDLARQSMAKLFNQFKRKRHAFAKVETALITSSRPPITICLSDREREQAMQMFPSARDRFVTHYCLPNGSRFSDSNIDARRKSMRKQLSLDEAATLFLFIGNDFARKGLATAIRAIGQMPDPRATLIVVGGGDTHRYSQIALRAGALGRVMFVGRNENVGDFLSAADALVLPTRFEPFGMVVVEAMLMGVPPIVSAVAGASEVVENGKSGFVINDPNDIAAWAAAMSRLTDRSLRQSLSRDCLRERERFSYENHVSAIEAIYRSVASRKNS